MYDKSATYMIMIYLYIYEPTDRQTDGVIGMLQFQKNLYFYVSILDFNWFSNIIIEHDKKALEYHLYNQSLL